jgi:hypothetical protein
MGDGTGRPAYGADRSARAGDDFLAGASARCGAGAAGSAFTAGSGADSGFGALTVASVSVTGWAVAAFALTAGVAGPAAAAAGRSGTVRRVAT